MPTRGSEPDREYFDRLRIVPADGVVGPGLARLHGEAEPRVSVASLSPSRPDRLLLVLEYDCADHFHYLSVGVRRLSPGWEQELSFRLARTEDGEPPDWPVRLIARYASHLSRAGLALAAGSYVRLAEFVDPQSRWRSFALAPDPRLPETHLAILALEDEELSRWADDGWRAAAARIAQRSPLWIAGERL